MQILKIEGLTKTFGGLTAVENISFEANKGEILAIIGPNGAGKTTLFNMITGVYTPTSGKINFNGQDIAGRTSDKIAALGITRTFQNLQIFGNMTVLENVMVGCHTKSKTGFLGAIFPLGRVHKEEKAIEENARQKISWVGLGDKAEESATNLTYGQQKMLEIARAMAMEPSLLLLDEPAAGLNPTETRELVELIYTMKDLGITILLVEHDMETVMEIADKIVVLNFGTKLAEGSPYDIQNNHEVISAYLGEEESVC